MALDFEQLQESPTLLDILIQMEDILDSMDVYVFPNWLKGEVVEGPNVRRYWVDMTLLYPFNAKSKDRGMPDPKAALRLLKHGIRVDYDRGRYENTGDDEPTRIDAETADDRNDENLVWLLRVSMPRRLIVQMEAAQHDFYDDEVDIDQVEDAKDTGLDDESGYETQDEGEMPMDDSDAMGGPGGPPGGPQGGPGGPPPPGQGGGL